MNLLHCYKREEKLRGPRGISQHDPPKNYWLPEGLFQDQFKANLRSALLPVVNKTTFSLKITPLS